MKNTFLVLQLSLFFSDYVFGRFAFLVQRFDEPVYVSFPGANLLGYALVADKALKCLMASQGENRVPVFNVLGEPLDDASSICAKRSMG